jgi:hypothetical protein
MVNTNPKRRGYLSLGSGRAICQLCGEKIANGVPQINHRANEVKNTLKRQVVQTAVWF